MDPAIYKRLLMSQNEGYQTFIHNKWRVHNEEY
jgi:hypothetical protein